MRMGRSQLYIVNSKFFAFSIALFLSQSVHSLEASMTVASAPHAFPIMF